MSYKQTNKINLIRSVSASLAVSLTAPTLLAQDAAPLKPAQEISAPEKGTSETPGHHGFAPPEILLSFSDAVNGDGQPLGYPASAVLDIDGDGDQELIVGTIKGYFTKFENTNKDQAKPNWGNPEFLKTSSGKRIKLDNC